MSQRSVTKRTLYYYVRAAWRYPVLTILLLILLVLSVFAGTLGQSFFLSQLFETLSTSTIDADRARQLFSFVAALIFLDAFVLWRVIGFTFVYRQSRILRDLEQMVFSRLIGHSYKFFANNFAGSLVTQAGRFVRSYETLEDSFFFEILGLLLRFCVISTVLVLLAPALGISIAFFAIFYVASVMFLTIKKVPVSRRAAAADSKVTGNLADAITNVLNIKIFARKAHEVERYKEVTDWRRRMRSHSWNLDEGVRMYQGFLLGGFYILYLWIAVNTGISGEASFATILLGQFYIHRIYGDLFSFERVVRRVEQSLTDAVEMTQILDQPLGVKDPVDPDNPEIDRGKIDFRSVSFRYGKRDNRVFHNFNLSVPAGQKVGLVGHSGSGKTTLTKLLLRFADIQGGKILIDEQDIARLAQEDLRSHFAYVPQEPILFHRSLMENIRYGRLDATDEEVQEAAKLAHASDFIDNLPLKYDTLVGERGIKLSGGEKQRVAIARAMLSRSPILILDEATSALDSKSEKLIAEALDLLMKGRTTLVIAHRLSTIRRLDRIVVLDSGKLVEDGSHDALLKKKGVYHELWSHQSGDFIE